MSTSIELTGRGLKAHAADIMRHAAEDFTETYGRTGKEVERLRNLLRLMQACDEPLEQRWNINALINELKTLDRHLRKTSHKVTVNKER